VWEDFCITSSRLKLAGLCRIGNSLKLDTLGAGVLWLPTNWAKLSASLIKYRLGPLPGGMNVGGLFSFDLAFCGCDAYTALHPP
jgi:hypothetical protein